MPQQKNNKKMRSTMTDTSRKRFHKAVWRQFYDSSGYRVGYEENFNHIVSISLLTK